MHNLSGTRLPGVQLTGSCNIISPNCKMYFSDSRFQKKNMYLSEEGEGLQECFCKMHLFKAQGVFVQKERCICFEAAGAILRFAFCSNSV